jgi:hypothetical protein
MTSPEMLFVIMLYIVVFGKAIQQTRPKQQVHVVSHEPMALQKTINLATLHFCTPQPLSQTQLHMHARARVIFTRVQGSTAATIIGCALT